VKVADEFLEGVRHLTPPFLRLSDDFLRGALGELPVLELGIEPRELLG
jgi:hypothetical protein